MRTFYYSLKRTCTWLLFLYLLNSPLVVNAQNNVPLAPDQSNEYLQGALFFKLKQTSPISKQLSGLSYQERQQTLFTAFQFESDYGVVAIKPVFKLLESRYPNLATVYQVQFENIEYTEALLAYLSGRAEIEYAERIPRRQVLQPPPSYTPNDPQFGSQWYLDFIEAQEAYWQFSNCSPTGNMSSIRIAIIDDAVYTTHQDLAASIWTNVNEIPSNGIDDDRNGFIDDVNGWDFGDNDKNTNPPISGSCAVSGNHFYHGTHVAGIAAAVNDNALGISSLGGGAHIIPIKCGRDNFTTHCGEAVFNTTDGIEYAIHAGAHIINCSWGGKIYSYTEELIVNTAHIAGIVVVAAAGNEGQESIYYPAAYTNVIAVGATNSSDQITSFSNYGSKIDVMAPGYNILSCLPKNTSDYGTLSGTSMATPLVSGLVAMIMALDNQLTPDEIRDILKTSAENIYSLNASKYAGKLGAGRINAYRAVLSICSSYSRVFDITSNFQTVCPGQLAHFIAVERKNRPVTNISWLFPGSATLQNGTTLNPAVAYANEGVYDVTFNYTDGYGIPQSMTLKNYITVRINSGNFSSEVDNHMYINRYGNIQFNNGLTSAKNNVPYWGEIEGVATISNADGNLLFYNIEGTVYNRFHQVMPNGAGLHGASTTQTLIVPAPGTCNSQYYLFTTGNQNTTGLFYSVIDMNADKGRGDIIATSIQIPIPLPPPSANIINEKMTAVPHCNGTDLWVLFQEDNTRNIWTFRITPTGIMAPIVSVTATTEEHMGVIKASPTGDKIAVGNDLNNSVDVYNFNRASGIMTPYCSTLLTNRAYSCEFSPNGNILYIGQFGNIIQIDLTSINCSQTTVNLGHPTEVFGLELGPNGRIYFTHSPLGTHAGFNPNLRRFIGCIRSPNTLGLGCNVSLQELEMGINILQTTLANGVISRFINYRRDYLLQLPQFVIKCQGSTVTVSSNYQGPAPFFRQWYKPDGTIIAGETGPSIVVLDPGIYELKVTDNGGCIISAEVTVADEIISQLFAPIMEIECGGTLTLDAGPGFTSYLWSTGETTQSIVVSQPGNLLIKVTTQNGCESTQEIKLETTCCKVENSSDPFEKEYYSKRYGIIPQGMIRNGTNYIIAGTSYDKTVANGQPMAERGISLLCIDQKGELVWKKRYTIADLYPWTYNPSVSLYDQMGFRVEDMRAGPDNFVMTCLAINTNGQMVSLVAFVNYSGTILSVREYENSSPGGNLQLNSIDDSYDDVTGAKDGYIVTGTRHDGSNYEIVYLKFLYTGAVAYDNAVSFPGVVTSYAHGMESCANLRISNNGLDGYIIAGIHTYDNGGVLNKSLVLMRTFSWGQVNLVRRLNNAYQPGSDFKLLPTTDNNGQNRAFLFMFSTSAGTYDQERINLIKFDNNLGIIWAYQYEVATGSDFAHAYDIIETTAGYKILAQNNNTMAVVFDVAGSGIPLTSTLSQTGLPLSGGQYMDDFYIESYSDKFIQEGNNWVTTSCGSHQGAGIKKWDINNEVSCGDSYEFTNTTIEPDIEYVNYSQQGVGYIHHGIEPPSPIDLELNKYCCDNGQTQETENGCYFTFDFDFNAPCGLNTISITGVTIFGAMGGTPTYSWTLDGNVVSALELPNILNVANGIHQVCITITYYPGCSKTVCKNITIGPIIDHDTISTCQPFIWYTPDGCDKYYSYEIFGPDNFNFNSLTYGPGCQGWVIHQLNLGEYIINLKDQSGCIKKILHLSVIPGTITRQKDIYLCPGQCKTVDILNPDFFCQPNNGLFSGDFDDGFTMFYYPPSPQVTFCYPQSGSYEFTTIASNGCSCIVTGNVILYAPCPMPSEPGGGISSIDQMGNETYTLQVFPNPTTGRVTLKYLGTIQPGATITLTDLLGKQHFQGPLMEYKELDMSILASGVYMLSVRNGEKLIHQKVVRE